MTSARKSDRAQVRLEMPLVQVFRMTAERGDARRPSVREDDTGARLLTSARSAGGGTDERALRQALVIDLTNLLNTINLAASVDLSDHPAVSRSILNYGVDDMVSLTTGSTALGDLAETLRQALLAHEPRLVAGTLAVARHESDDALDQRVRFHVAAELRCRPVDLPVEFVAEIDIGSGKLDIREEAGLPQGPAARAG